MPLNELEIFSLNELYVLSSVENFVATFKFIARYFALAFYVKFEDEILKFEYKESRRRIFSSDEAAASEARERIYNT